MSKGYFLCLSVLGKIQLTSLVKCVTLKMFICFRKVIVLTSLREKNQKILKDGNRVGCF